MSTFALNISAHSRRETRNECENVHRADGRGRESEIREWNVRNNPGGVKVKVVADSATRRTFSRDRAVIATVSTAWETIRNESDQLGIRPNVDLAVLEYLLAQLMATAKCTWWNSFQSVEYKKFEWSTKTPEM